MDGGADGTITIHEKELHYGAVPVVTLDGPGFGQRSCNQMWRVQVTVQVPHGVAR